MHHDNAKCQINSIEFRLNTAVVRQPMAQRIMRQRIQCIAIPPCQGFGGTSELSIASSVASTAAWKNSLMTGWASLKRSAVSTGSAGW
jgi:hypothetical protein